MSKSTKILLITIGIITFGVGIWSYLSEKDLFNTYFALGIGAALMITVFSVQSKNEEG
ncbi:hypothetical protein [Flagellimonas lutimaris]|uniref:hypothetical protein n=1 Tax=Flagellimonas lutimaris TaxID=475082 RepID=UPI001601DE31|nr:hypothetical protein [Allomuricauda lutimaris]